MSIDQLTALADSPSETTVSDFNLDLTGEQGTATHRLRGPGDALYTANGLTAPIGAATVEIDGQSQLVDVVASIQVSRNRSSSDKECSYLWLTRQQGNSESPLQISRVQREGDKLISHHLGDIDETQPVTIPVTTEDGSYDDRAAIRFLPSDPKYRDWSSIRVKRMYASVAVSEGSHPKYESWHQARDKMTRIRRAKFWGAVALAAFAFKGTTAPGGVYDRVMDGGSNAGEFVHDSLMPLEDRSNISTTENLPNGETRPVYGHELQERYLSSVKRLARTMGDLDTHRFDVIARRAHEFKNLHQRDLVTQEEINISREALAKSSSTEEAMEVMAFFLENYEANPDIDEDIPLSTRNSDNFHSKIQFAGDQIITLLGNLPISLVREAIGGDRNKGYGSGIKFAFGVEKKELDSLTYGDAVAYWDGSYLTFLSTGRLAGVPLADFERIVAHELTHALPIDDPLAYYHNLESKNDTAYRQVFTRVKNLGSHILGSPDFTSDYATSDREEETAENGSDILRGDIPNPDHVLDFTSRANVSRMKVLAALEEKMPGLTDYLIYRLRPDMLDLPQSQ